MTESLSDHFNRAEFACRCGCGQDTVDAALIDRLETLRAALGGYRMRINSGNRCETHNRNEDGEPKSLHLVSKAADVVVEEITPEEVASVADMLWPTSGGVGNYETFTHIDVRPGFWRG